MSEAVLREAYEGRLVALTGHNWCPYPSGMFMEAVVELPDDAALALIEARRKMGFTMFCGVPDPQTAAIEAAIACARGSNE